MSLLQKRYYNEHFRKILDFLLTKIKTSWISPDLHYIFLD